MANSPPPYPEQMRFDPWRKPTWRWDRACDLVNSGQYLSRKRDDEPTAIAGNYVRETKRSLSELRLRRVRRRFHYLVKAHEVWQSCGMDRLELETRILAHQNDTEIGLEMGLPAPTVQAYADLFFNIRDRLTAGSYIQFQVIQLHALRAPTAVQLMQACVYHHGPHLIEPWLDYLRQEDRNLDLASDAGRLMESLDLLLSFHALSDDIATSRSLVKRFPSLLKTAGRFPVPGTAEGTYGKSTNAIIKNLDLPRAHLEPMSYAPITKSPRRFDYQQHSRKAA